MTGKSLKPSHETPRKGETSTHPTELTVERGEKGGGMLEDALPCKTTLPINAIVVVNVHTQEAHGILVHAHIKNTTDNYKNTGTICC